MNKIVLITPIWKDKFNYNEYLNIKSSIECNKNCSHYFIHDEGLNLEYYKSKFNKSHFKGFKKGTFKSIKTYNILMLSNNFYELFAEYENLIILQSDAILLKSIQPLVNLNFDFIGPNWRLKKTIPYLTKYRYLSYILKTFGFYTKTQIGNGGLSLRKVSSFIKLTKNDKLVKFSWMNEDLVFSKLLLRNKYKIPAYNENTYFVEEIIFPEKIKYAYGYHAHEKFIK